MGDTNYMNSGISSPDSNGGRFNVHLSPIDQIRIMTQDRDAALQMHENQMELQRLDIARQRAIAAEYEANAPVRAGDRAAILREQQQASELDPIQHKYDKEMAMFHTTPAYMNAIKNKETQTLKFENTTKSMENTMFDLNAMGTGVVPIRNELLAKQKAIANGEPYDDARLESAINQAAIYFESMGQTRPEFAKYAQELRNNPEEAISDVVQEYDSIEQQIIPLRETVAAARKAQAEITLERIKAALEKDWRLAVAKEEGRNREKNKTLENIAADILKLDPSERKPWQDETVNTYVAIEMAKDSMQALLTSWYSEGGRQAYEQYLINQGRDIEKDPPTFTEFMSDSMDTIVSNMRKRAPLQTGAQTGKINNQTSPEAKKDSIFLGRKVTYSEDGKVANLEGYGKIIRDVPYKDKDGNTVIWRGSDIHLVKNWELVK